MVAILNKHEIKKGKLFDVIMLAINVICFLFGILYLFFGKDNNFWNIYGYLMLTAFIGNIALAFMEEKNKKIAYLYLVLTSLWMLLLPLINTVVSSIPTNQKSQSNFSVVFILSLFLIGGNIAANNIFGKEKEEGKPIASPIPEKLRGIRRYAIRTIMALLTGCLFCGIFIVLDLLRENKEGFSEVFVPEYSLFYGLSFLSLGTFIRKYLGTEKLFVFRSIVLTVSMGIFMVSMLPLVSIPLLLKNAKNTYTEAFGTDFLSNPLYTTNEFRQVPFSLPQYFYGISSGDYMVQENILYYEGKSGVDKGIKLYFDAYVPTRDASELPGGNSVLIRIHGGGWTIGDKGALNFAQMNKYFAKQGYIVFDIQYGLNNLDKLIDFVPVDTTRQGSFTIDDMVRHIGLFTDYLVDHQKEYHANLDSVFLSGGSAGGHLSLASGLAFGSGKYSDILNPRVTVKGLIPFYPSNGMSRILGIEGRNEFVDPSLLVTKDSPPCLIYQGSHDGVVDPLISKEFRDEYLTNGNSACALISMPFGGHGSDLYFAGYYNQVFLYYMERFMYQYR
ncbi:MAG: hypothetical protein K0S47_1240 [Herbinix sp.]|jgi:acetyl esterase/lipase|nr:hypothetical protein [Herbinix sp.]